jgi:hypothetical protein
VRTPKTQRSSKTGSKWQPLIFGRMWPFSPMFFVAENIVLGEKGA